MRAVATKHPMPVNQSQTDIPRSPHHVSQRYRRARTLRNLAFKRLVTLCGGMVVLTLALLIWQLVSQVLPIGFAPQLALQTTLSLPPSQQVLLVDDITNGRAVVVRDADCHTLFKALDDAGQLVDFKRIPGRCVEQVKALSVTGENYLARMSSSGLLRIESVSQINSALAHSAIMSFSLLEGAFTPQQAPVLPQQWYLALSAAKVMVSVKTDERWQVFIVERADPARITRLAVGQADRITLLPNIGQFAVLRGSIWTFYDEQQGVISTHQLEDVPHYVTALPGDRSMLVNYPDGRTENWSFINQQGQFIPMVTAHYDERFRIRQALFSADTNAALFLSEDNDLIVANYVTAQSLSQVAADPSIVLASWQGEMVHTFNDAGIQVWHAGNLSSVPTWQAIFDRVWYEGYDSPSYVWQTTYASDYQVAKYSIVPLLIGSFKAALLALLIAIPIATMAAVYTAYFAPQRLRAWLKPGIEMLEAIPSVVIGFIAAVWLAPLAEQFLLSMLLFVLLLPLMLLVYSAVQRRMVSLLPKPMRRGWEMLFIGVFLLILAGIATYLGDSSLPQGMSALSDAIWQTWGEGYADKSTLVVALALGVAISPSIYTLAEDAIYEVPASLKQASFALGATRYQTLRNVVLVAALPGIMSAIMLGFGRAFGETMIVLMVSGNTPVADWSPFTALRALTANLAIELPESEVGSGHYRIMFLTALLLFIFTFVVNSIAEWLKNRMRKQVSHG